MRHPLHLLPSPSSREWAVRNKLVAEAIRHFMDHDCKGRDRCPHLTSEEREALDSWVERTVEHGGRAGSGLSVQQNSSRGFDSHRVHGEHYREGGVMSLPKEIRSLIRKPLEYGYTVRKIRDGRGTTLMLVDPLGRSVFHVPQTAAYADRLRDFKSKVKRLALDEMYRREPVSDKELEVIALPSSPATHEPGPVTPPSPADEEWLTAIEAGVLLGVSDSRVQQFRDSVPLTHKQVRSSYTTKAGLERRVTTTVFARSDVEALAEKRASGQAGKIIPWEHRRGAKARRQALPVAPASPQTIAAPMPVRWPTVTSARPKSGPVRVSQGEPQTEKGKFSKGVRDLRDTLRAEQESIQQGLSELLERTDVLVQQYEDVVKERDELRAKIKKFEDFLGRGLEIL